MYRALGTLRRSPVVALLVLVSFVLSSLPHPARADVEAPAANDSSVIGPGGAATGLGIPDSGSAAAAGDLASIDPSTGQLGATYPFELPTARGKVQPRLALAYSSSAGDADAGFGWSVSIPLIERRNPRGGAAPNYADPASDEAQPDGRSMDGFFYNGEPLVPICQMGGGNPSCSFGAIPPFGDPSAAFPGWFYFRMQNETGPSSAFLWSDDRKSWLVFDQKGTMSEFGVIDDTSGVVDGTESDTLRDGRTAIVRWHLTRQHDAQFTAAGAWTNPILYRWSDGQLTDIFDTPQTPDAPTLESYAHHVRLTYDDFPYPRAIPPRWRATPRPSTRPRRRNQPRSARRRARRRAPVSAWVPLGRWLRHASAPHTSPLRDDGGAMRELGSRLER